MSEKEIKQILVISLDELKGKRHKVVRETRWGSENQEIYMAYEKGYLDACSDIEKAGRVVSEEKLWDIIYCEQHKMKSNPTGNLAKAILSYLRGENG